MDIDKIFSSIVEENPWNNTYVANYYGLTPKKKGMLAEKIVEKILIELGYDVLPAINLGHDRIINNIKTEIKFGLATNANTNWETIFNHISLNKDWEQIIFACINGDLSIRIVCFKRDNLPACIMKYQQGGKNIQNDDFIISGKNSAKILFDNNAEVIWTS